jgi:hypothetical protein
MPASRRKQGNLQSFDNTDELSVVASHDKQEEVQTTKFLLGLLDEADQ